VEGSFPGRGCGGVRRVKCLGIGKEERAGRELFSIAVEVDGSVDSGGELDTFGVHGTTKWKGQGALRVRLRATGKRSCEGKIESLGVQIIRREEKLLSFHEGKKGVPRKSQGKDQILH